MNADVPSQRVMRPADRRWFRRGVVIAVACAAAFGLLCAFAFTPGFHAGLRATADGRVFLSWGSENWFHGVTFGPECRIEGP